MKADLQNVNQCVGGLIELSEGRPQNLQYVVNAAFLASLYGDYLDGVNLPGWYCGATFIPLKTLRDFASSQVRNTNLQTLRGYTILTLVYMEIF